MPPESWTQDGTPITTLGNWNSALPTTLENCTPGDVVRHANKKLHDLKILLSVKRDEVARLVREIEKWEAIVT